MRGDGRSPQPGPTAPRKPPTATAWRTHHRSGRATGERSPPLATSLPHRGRRPHRSAQRRRTVPTSGLPNRAGAGDLDADTSSSRTDGSHRPTRSTSWFRDRTSRQPRSPTAPVSHSHGHDLRRACVRIRTRRMEPLQRHPHCARTGRRYRPPTLCVLRFLHRSDRYPGSAQRRPGLGDPTDPMVDSHSSGLGVPVGRARRTGPVDHDRCVRLGHDLAENVDTSETGTDPELGTPPTT